MNQKVKISRDDITIGPKEPDAFDIAFWAHHLTKEGYRRASNAYCLIVRPDRDDWIDVLATKMNCCNADYYMKDGSGPSPQWRDHYSRIYSTDKQTVAPEILRKIPSCS